MIRNGARAALTIIAAGLALTIAPVTASSNAQPPAAVVAVDRALPLTGAANARDVGGYTTGDGRIVRTGLVYRTGQLNKLTVADLEELRHRQVRSVDDLRTAFERAIAPDRVPEGAVANWYDVLGHASPGDLISGSSEAAVYRPFVTTPGAHAAFAGVLRDIIGTTDGAVLYHCTAGKDRTGWATAVLLTILGVDRKTVTADYLLSNLYHHTTSEDIVHGVKQSWLDSAFEEVDARYGDFDAYVRDGLGLSGTEIASLRAKMLA